MLFKAFPILNEFKTFTENTDDLFSYYDGTFTFALVDKPDKTIDLSKHKGYFNAMFDYLIEHKYIAKSSLNSEHFYLTAKGLHPFIASADVIALFILVSVLTPVLVSIITTIVTMSLLK